jgi:hypothetical protein
MHPLNILFTDKQGKPGYLLLGGGPDRRLRTMHAEERGHWGQGARFIVIRKRASEKKSAVKRLQSLERTPISSSDLDVT